MITHIPLISNIHFSTGDINASLIAIIKELEVEKADNILLKNKISELETRIKILEAK